MNINKLRTESKSISSAYIIYFIFQAHYAYIGKWKLQFLYWLVSIQFFFRCRMLIFQDELFEGIDYNEVMVFMVILYGIWPLNQLLAIPNKIKKYNLEVYKQLKR